MNGNDHWNIYKFSCTLDTKNKHQKQIQNTTWVIFQFNHQVWISKLRFFVYLCTLPLVSQFLSSIIIIIVKPISSSSYSSAVISQGLPLQPQVPIFRCHYKWTCSLALQEPLDRPAHRVACERSYIMQAGGGQRPERDSASTLGRYIG